MTKQEIIQEAYGEHWKYFNGSAKQCALNNNGWISPILEHRPKDIDLDFGEKNIYRPKSLHDIETNNGWIKIESEKDVPLTTSKSYVYRSGMTSWYSEVYSHEILHLWREKEITHYQPIIKPKSPIY